MFVVRLFDRERNVQIATTLTCIPDICIHQFRQLLITYGRKMSHDHSFKSLYQQLLAQLVFQFHLRRNRLLHNIVYYPLNNVALGILATLLDFRVIEGVSLLLCPPIFGIIHHHHHHKHPPTK